MARTLFALCVFTCFSGCPKNIDARPAAERKAVRLLALTAERETLKIPEVAAQLEADTDQERTPHVVAVGESPLMSAEGADLFLAGDDQGTLGFTVDNCILLEVLSEDVKRLGRAAVGYLNGLAEGKEQIDLLGRRAFAFEPNEVNLVSLLPEHGRFRVRATVLDIGGVGHVSDVFLIVAPRSAAVRDDLREK